MRFSRGAIAIAVFSNVLRNGTYYSFTTQQGIFIPIFGGNCLNYGRFGIQANIPQS
jgi:hypothetical protein